jgi:hypothetical protein
VAAPTTCSTGGGYGNVPAPFLEVNWFAAASTTPIAGSAAGVSISNDCYDGTTLHGPVLSGTIPVPSTLTVGTTYKAYVCELNITPYPSNDANATTDCGPPGCRELDRRVLLLHRRARLDYPDHAHLQFGAAGHGHQRAT